MRVWPLPHPGMYGTLICGYSNDLREGGGEGKDAWRGVACVCLCVRARVLYSRFSSRCTEAQPYIIGSTNHVVVRGSWRFLKRWLPASCHDACSHVCAS